MMINFKINRSTNLLLAVFSFAFVFGSIGTYGALNSTIFFNKLFILPFLGINHFFSLLELIFIFIAFSFIRKYGKDYKENDKTLKLIFLFAIIVYILKMINPNNSSSNPILGMPLLSEVTNYSFLLLLYFSFFLKKDIYIEIIKKLFYYVGVILTLRVIFLFLLWLQGKGNYFFGANSTTTEGDTLFLIAFYQIAFFTIYLITNKRKYLFLTLFYLLFQFLSFRRSALGVALASNIMLYVLYVLRGANFNKKLVFVLLVILSLTAAKNVRSFNLPSKYEIYVLRFISAIPGFGEKNSREFNDSGHWEQTTKTFYSAIETLGFWGGGYGKSSQLYLYGQSTVVHNVYAAGWLFYGFYMVVFILTLIIISLFKSLNIFFTKNLSNPTILIQLSISLYLLAWFAVISTNPLMVFNTFKMELFWVTLFTVMLRLEPTLPKNYSEGTINI